MFVHIGIVQAGNEVTHLENKEIPGRDGHLILHIGEMCSETRASNLR